MVLLNLKPVSAPMLPVVTPPESEVQLVKEDETRPEAPVAQISAEATAERPASSPLLSPAASVPSAPTSPRLSPPLSIDPRVRRLSLPASLDGASSMPSRGRSAERRGSNASNCSAYSVQSCSSVRSNPGPADYSPSPVPRSPIPQWTMHTPRSPRQSWFEETASRNSSPGPARYGSRSSLALSDGTAFSASRTPRFPSAPRTPGPGDYEAVHRPSSSTSTAAFSRQTSPQRPEWGSIAPGPGAYRPETARSRSSTPGRFGTERCARKISNLAPRDADEPGPAAYGPPAPPRTPRFTFGARHAPRGRRYISAAHTKELVLTHSPGHLYTPREPSAPRTRAACTWGGAARFGDSAGDGALDSALARRASLFGI